MINIKPIKELIKLLDSPTSFVFWLLDNRAVEIPVFNERFQKIGTTVETDVFRNFQTYMLDSIDEVSLSVLVDENEITIAWTVDNEKSCAFTIDTPAWLSLFEVP